MANGKPQPRTSSLYEQHEVKRHTRDMAGDVAQHAPIAFSEMGEHAQKLVGEVPSHVQDATSEVVREVPTLVDDVKKSWGDLFGDPHDRKVTPQRRKD